MQFTSWPKIIGLSVAAVGFGSGLAASAAGFFWSLWHYGFRGEPHHYFAVAVVVISWSTCLGYPVYRGRDWARRVVLWLAVAITCCMAIYCGFNAYFDILQGAEPKWTQEDFHLFAGNWSAWAMSLALSLVILTPFVFLICVLRHPDVVKAFTKPAPESHEAKA